MVFPIEGVAAEHVVHKLSQNGCPLVVAAQVFSQVPRVDHQPDDSANASVPGQSGSESFPGSIQGHLKAIKVRNLFEVFTALLAFSPLTRGTAAADIRKMKPF